MYCLNTVIFILFYFASFNVSSLNSWIIKQAHYKYSSYSIVGFPISQECKIIFKISSSSSGLSSLNAFFIWISKGLKLFFLSNLTIEVASYLFLNLATWLVWFSISVANIDDKINFLILYSFFKKPLKNGREN